MAIPVYLWLIDDAGNQVKGSVDIHNREGSIEILELMHNVELPTDGSTGKVTRRCQHGDYALIKEVDSSSPWLYKGVASGKKFSKAELKFFRVNHNGQEEEYFRVTMENVRVNEIEPFMFDIKNPTFARHNHLEAFYEWVKVPFPKEHILLDLLFTIVKLRHGRCGLHPTLTIRCAGEMAS